MLGLFSKSLERVLSTYFHRENELENTSWKVILFSLFMVHLMTQPRTLSNMRMCTGALMVAIF